MLDRLHEIGWKNHNAENVPKWLMDLLSSDEKTRINAQQSLDERVIKINDQNHDSGYGISKILNTKTPLLIVPFLIEMLGDDSTPERARIVDMLIAMMGYMDMKYEGEEYVSLAWNIYEEIWKGFDVYLKLISDTDNYVRSGIVSLLCDFQTYSEIVLPHIRKAIHEEQNEKSKQWMLQRFKKRFPDEDLPE